MQAALERLVRERGGEMCEYCRLGQEFTELLFVIDHIIARQHGGATVEGNLALSCEFCNRHKGPNIASVDPDTNAIVPLFNPRQDRWTDHFRWDGATVVGLTPSARATIRALSMNHPVQWFRRSALLAEGGTLNT